VSTLQCPATLLVVRDDADLSEVSAGRRISHVWSADPAAGALAARRLGVGCSVVEALASGEVHALREALGDIADRTPGETTVVLGLDDLRAALAVVAHLEAAPAEAEAADSLELVIDADDWTCRPGSRDVG
jgi:hypothetical protein